MRFQLNFHRLLMFSFFVPALAACLAVMPSTPSDDKCPDGSKKDPELGCRQSTRIDMSHAQASKNSSQHDANVYVYDKGASSSGKASSGNSSASSSDAVGSTETSSTANSSETSSSANAKASSAGTEAPADDDKCPDGSKKDPELGCRQSTRVADAGDTKKASNQDATAGKSRKAKKATTSKKASQKKGAAGSATSNPK